MIQRIIVTGSNSYGIAAIYMNHDGKREVLFVDDYILCNETGPIFSQPMKSKDMWPCILEKAWFKFKSAFRTKIDKIQPI